MWGRWQKGGSLHQIARLFDRHHPSIQRILAESGGNTESTTGLLDSSGKLLPATIAPPAAIDYFTTCFVRFIV